MVTEWDKLKTDMDKITADLSDIGFVIEWAKLWVPIEKFVDDLVAKNQIQDEQLLQQSLEMEEKEDLLQLANGRCNELARELGEARAENQKLHEQNDAIMRKWDETIKMLSDDEKRLEAIREITKQFDPPTFDCGNCRLEEAYDKILEVLGGE